MSLFNVTLQFRSGLNAIRAYYKMQDVFVWGGGGRSIWVWSGQYTHTPHIINWLLSNDVIFLQMIRSHNLQCLHQPRQDHCHRKAKAGRFRRNLRYEII